MNDQLQYGMALMEAPNSDAWHQFSLMQGDKSAAPNWENWNYPSGENEVTPVGGVSDIIGKLLKGAKSAPAFTDRHAKVLETIERQNPGLLDRVKIGHPKALEEYKTLYSEIDSKILSQSMQEQEMRKNVIRGVGKPPLIDYNSIPLYKTERAAGEPEVVQRRWRDRYVNLKDQGLSDEEALKKLQSWKEGPSLGGRIPGSGKKSSDPDYLAEIEKEQAKLGRELEYEDTRRVYNRILERRRYKQSR